MGSGHALCCMAEHTSLTAVINDNCIYIEEAGAQEPALALAEVAAAVRHVSVACPHSTGSGLREVTTRHPSPARGAQGSSELCHGCQCDRNVLALHAVVFSWSLYGGSCDLQAVSTMRGHMETASGEWTCRIRLTRDADTLHASSQYPSMMLPSTEAQHMGQRPACATKIGAQAEQVRVWPDGWN